LTCGVYRKFGSKSLYYSDNNLGTQASKTNENTTGHTLLSTAKNLASSTFLRFRNGLKKERTKLKRSFTFDELVSAEGIKLKAILIDLIHDTRYLWCSRSSTDGMKAMSRGFPRGKQVNLSMQEISVKFVYSRQQKMTEELFIFKAIMAN